MTDKYKRKSIWASSPNTVRGENIVLGGDPKGKNFLYVNGSSVFIRDIENPNIVDVYSDHQYQTTVAKYSPSGFYIASGDVNGYLRIWDTVNPEHVLYKEYTPFGGAIRDIAWTEDSKRLVVVGEGRSCYGVAILADSGSTVGKIDNINKRANSCDVKQTRPYRVITGSDDFRVNFYEGPPFKYKCKLSEHSNFVFCTRFAPDGSLFSTASRDGKCLLYDGKTAEFKLELGGGNNAHNGSVYSTAWSGDSKQILTVSGDKTAKIWDAETGSVVTEFTMGTAVEDQQVGCLWQNNYILSVSLNGDINYLDPNDPSKPCRVIQGHQKAIKGFTVNSQNSKVYSGSFDGVTNCWDVESGYAKTLGGNTPKHMTSMDFSEEKISTVSVDDTLRIVDAATNEYMEESCSLDSQPQDVARAGNLSIVAEVEKVTVIRDVNKASVLDVAFNPSAVAIHPNQSEVAVGAQNGEIHIFTLAADKLTEKKSITDVLNETITKCRYSPDGEHLLVGCASKIVELFKVQADYEPLGRTDYKHDTRVTDVSWSPDGRHYASTCLGGDLFVWSLEQKRHLFAQKRVHGRKEATCVRWLSDHTLATAGGDSCVRVADVTL